MSEIDIRELDKLDIKYIQFTDPTKDGVYKLKLTNDILGLIDENEDLCGEVGYNEIDDLVKALRYVQKLRIDQANKMGDW